MTKPVQRCGECKATGATFHSFRDERRAWYRCVEHKCGKLTSGPRPGMAAQESKPMGRAA